MKLLLLNSINSGQLNGRTRTPTKLTLIKGAYNFHNAKANQFKSVTQGETKTFKNVIEKKSRSNRI